MMVFERAALKRAAQSVVKMGVAWAVAHVSGRWGVTIDPVQLGGAAYVGLTYIAHAAAVRYPVLAPWLG
jgi:hypothetical protein